MINDIKKPKTLKVRTRAYLVLYTYINNNLNIILSRDSEAPFYKIPNTQVTQEDNVPTFSIVRMMISEYLGIFSENCLNKVYNKELLTCSDIRREPLKWFELIDSPDYHEWCEAITSQKVIQYDEFTDEIVYFLELKEVDISFLNGNLSELGINYTFCYYNQTEQSNIELDQQSKDLLTKFDLNLHIQNTLDAFKNNDFSYFIILSIKDGALNAKDQAGIFHFPALFQGMYKENKEKWLLYTAGTLIFPSDEILRKTKAIIIPGSALNLYNEIPFIPKTVEWLKELHTNYSQIKVLGICFGEQLICYAHGGIVDMLEQKKKDNSYFIRFPTAIQIKDDFWDIPFIKQSGVAKKNEYVISEAHGDEVTEHPDYFKNYGSSDTCKNEVFVSNDNRYFLIQGHPEYSPEFLVVRAFKFFTQGKVLQAEQMEKVRSNWMENIKLNVDKYEWRGFCFSFLKN